MGLPLEFLDLPTELKAKIYKHVFAEAKLTFNLSKDLPQRPPEFFQANRHLQLTCKIIKNGGEDILYATMRLHIDHNLSPSPFNLPLPKKHVQPNSSYITCSKLGRWRFAA